MESTGRSGKDLILATRSYAVEQRARTLGNIATTLIVLVGAVYLAATLPTWPARLAASIVEGLVLVRGFIIYHDVMHGALLRDSRIGRALFSVYGVLVLTPPNVWRQTHNYHHAHTAKIVGSHVGSFPVLTTAMWRKATPAQRLMYRVARHPFTVAVGYFTIFLYGMCVSSFLRNPRKNWDSALSIVVHVVLVAVLSRLFGFHVAFATLVLPLAIACALGGYLFYAQHNFPEIEIQPRETWSYTRAALESSSYMKMGPVMAWFTGNIGYHHVHHLNSAIPFYRLPEAMAEVPELQNPCVTTLWPRDIAACFRLKLWDADQHKMVGYDEAERSDAGPAEPAAHAA